MGNSAYFDVKKRGKRSLRGFLTPIHVGMNKCKTRTASHRRPDQRQQQCCAVLGGGRWGLDVCVHCVSCTFAPNSFRLLTLSVLISADGSFSLSRVHPLFFLKEKIYIYYHTKKWKKMKSLVQTRTSSSVTSQSMLSNDLFISPLGETFSPNVK